MSSDYPPVNLDVTVAAQWRSHLAGTGTEDRAHWRTKAAYYRAVNELIVAHQELTWSTIVEAVHPKGSRSTFYDVTGPRSKHPLIRDYLAMARNDSLQLALCYRRHKAVDQLIDETKVWSYWPARQAWLDQTRTDARTAETMLGAVTKWARNHPELAGALDDTPPACAVEDLVALHHGQLPAIRAWDVIRQAIVAAIGSPGRPGDTTTHPPDESLAPNLPARPTPPDPRILVLAEQLCAVRHQLRLLTPHDALAVRETAAALMATGVPS